MMMCAKVRLVAVCVAAAVVVGGTAAVGRSDTLAQGGASLPVSGQEQAVQQDSDVSRIILDTSSFWRVHYTIMPPVVMKDGKAVELEPCSWWVRTRSPMPPEDWPKPEFSDAGWARFPGVFHVSPHYGIEAYKSPFMALECMRGRFSVTDPTKVGKLTLSASYQGGIVIYLNGQEVARGHLPAGGFCHRC